MAVEGAVTDFDMIEKATRERHVDKVVRCVDVEL